MTNRLNFLDYLRGGAAAAIMVYHYLSWTSGKFSAETAMGRIGVYGVSLFYVLSGITLFHVYQQKLNFLLPSIRDFYRKRFFRIFPLLWLTTILAILLSGQLPELKKLLLNLTGLFGLVSWDDYFSAGIWSIGNELVFYLFFPLFVLSWNRSRWLMIAIGMAALVLYLWFAFYKIDPLKTIHEERHAYMNPLNQLFLFAGGFIIGGVFQHLQIKRVLNLLLLFGALGLFLFYPVSGDPILLVTGVPRIVFTGICFAICISFYKFNFSLPAWADRPLKTLGEISYSVYLLHPIVFISLQYFSTHIYRLPTGTFFVVLAMGTTLVCSYFVYRYFERYFMKFGRSPVLT